MRDLFCDCGGVLTPYHPLRDSIHASLAAIGKPREAKTKRLQKKHEKTWREQHQNVLRGCLILGALGPPKFRCTVCEKIVGFYEAMGKDLLQRL